MIQLSSKIVKIKKEHSCWGCGRNFAIGSDMELTVLVEDREISSVYWCKDCVEFMETLEPWEREEGFAYGDLLNYDELREKIFPRVAEAVEKEELQGRHWDHVPDHRIE